MSEAVVSAHALSKTYRVFNKPVDRLVEALLRKSRHTPFHALSDVSFEVQRGEGLGIIGENGAGKSTLLKILAGVTAPSSGSMSVARPVASILELGSAFHQEFTGRQNILLNAAMLGLSRNEVAERSPRIIEFSELGDFIDQPIKTYSTGMVMRLGFAIATQVDPDVLIIDEALSVGDGYFQQKCMTHLRKYVDNGGTLLICSHAMYYISAFCSRALWMRNGRIEALGPVDEVVRAYESFLLAKADHSEDEAMPVLPERDRATTISDVTLPKGQSYRQGDPLEVRVSWTTEDPTQSFHLAIGLNRPDEVQISSFLTQRSGVGPWNGSHAYSVVLTVPDLPLLKGDFKLYVYLLAEDGLHPHDLKIIDNAFSVEYDEYIPGTVAIPHTWEKVPEKA
ncbi:MAG: ABC transporter ATP-binding protein [Acidobacteria bacterium]|nr:MAG: ABC transporter ATP-binding protein [Acidobacteriota bacterium]